MMESVSRAALGHEANLGSLYDARTDSFCHISIFNQKIPEEAITVRDNHSWYFELMESDTYIEKFSKLDINNELRVSILAGLVPLHGSSVFLNDQKISTRTIKSDLMYCVKTIEESINIRDEDLKAAFNLETIASGVATHVVVGISWGANSVISCEYKNTDNEDVKELEDNLINQLTKIMLSISGDMELKLNEEDSIKDVNLDIQLFGDVIPRDRDPPTTFEGIWYLFNQMPDLIATLNEGRGKPLTYHLMPLSRLEDYLKLPTKADSTVDCLDEKCLLRTVEVFDMISLSQQGINDFYEDAIGQHFCVRLKDVERIMSLKAEFADLVTELRDKLAKTLFNVRSGKGENSALEDLIEEYLSGDFAPDKLSMLFTGWRYITNKTAFAKSLIASGGTYIGYGSSVDEEISKNFDVKTFVFYFNEESKTKDTDKWNENCELFFKRMNTAANYKYLAVDCDIHTELWPVAGICVQVVQNGEVITKDLLVDQLQACAVPFAQNTLNMMKCVKPKPSDRVNLVIACAGKNCKPDVTYEWICRKCKKNIEYGFDCFLYCKCGRGRAGHFEFQCTDPDHGMSFEKHDPQLLVGLLSCLKPVKVMNILILGETGVGKSTWINGFANYVTHESLQGAEAGELKTLIPSKFTVCDENFDDITISTGSDKNEVQVAGQSATQESQVYTLELGDRRIRLIDTPGVGDTRGIARDKINFQNILSTISYLEDLHGICILLKPNNARLTIMFRFCINELLTYLHRDASHNIIFCFTNTRGTFYRPGDTMPALKSLLENNREVKIPLSQRNIFCYDSESYRFLAAVKNESCPVKFREKERESFIESWETSVVETERMLRYISCLTPHRIKSTLNLNHSRDVVIKLTKPLAEVSRMIQTIKEVIEDEKRDIERTKENFKQLEKKKKYLRPDLKIIQLSHPRTVCSNPNCKKFYVSGGEKKIKYVSICHDPCGLKGVTSDTIGHERLMNCKAMNGTEWCIRCSHHYKEHQHIYHDTEDIFVEVEDESIKELLKKCETAKELKQQMIEAKNMEVDEFNWELKEIEKASVQFAFFLKANAITPYNDAMIDYMDHLIKEEEGRVKIRGSDKVLKALIEGKASYEYQIKILDQEIAKSSDDGRNNVLGLEEVNGLINRLKELKNCGRKIQEALMAVDNTYQQKGVYNELVSSCMKPDKQNVTVSLVSIGKRMLSRFRSWFG